MSELTRYETRGDVALLTMDDGKANALSHAMIDAIHADLDRAEADARAVVLAGREGRFSAGFDLGVMQAGVDEARALVAAGGRLCARIFTLPIPVVVACTGHALAAGALVVLSGDHRVGARGDYKIGLNEVAIGLPLPQFAVDLAEERLSRRHITRATVLATIYGPDEAVDAGYLEELADDPVTTALDIAGELVERLSGFGFAGSRRTARQAVADKILRELDDDLLHFALDPDA